MHADRFYLGVHRPNWVTLPEFRGVPLFLSRRQIEDRIKTLPSRAVTRWALDSGGYTELDGRGEWSTTPQRYVDDVRRYADGLGMMDWASPQDWMCEPWILKNTGLTVEQHQNLTVENFATLRYLAPEIAWTPVLQGWSLKDYDRCAKLYEVCGFDLSSMDVVGVGSVCRRQSTEEIGEVFTHLHDELGLTNLHGFGVKAAGLTRYADKLKSSDSMAWSLRARWAEKTRRDQGLFGSTAECPKKTCGNCPHFAIAWRESILAKLDQGDAHE